MFLRAASVRRTHPVRRVLCVVERCFLTEPIREIKGRKGQDIVSTDKQADAFKRLWLGGPYESGQAFISDCMQHYRLLEEAEARRAFRAAVAAFARARNMEKSSPLRSLLESLETEPA